MLLGPVTQTEAANSHNVAAAHVLVCEAIPNRATGSIMDGEALANLRISIRTEPVRPLEEPDSSDQEPICRWRRSSRCWDCKPEQGPAQHSRAARHSWDRNSTDSHSYRGTRIPGRHRRRSPMHHLGYNHDRSHGSESHVPQSRARR